MATNANLHYSKKEQEDEFYTQLSTIEEELVFYTSHFMKKTVYCNADNPKYSQFWKYFKEHFHELGLKKLYATYLDDAPFLYCYDGVAVEEKAIENGSFDSSDCLQILNDADIVVTNPPFSQFKSYMDMLINCQKQFLILGNLNSVTYANIMPLISSGKVWLGINSGHYWFKVPSWYEEKRTDFKIDDNGQKWRRMGNICWYTNLDIPQRYSDIPLDKSFSEDDYDNCTNVDSIFIRYVADIPKDYNGKMAVPITILPKLSPNQFTLLGFDKELTSNKGRVRIMIDGQEKVQYARAIIRRNTNVEGTRKSI